MFGFTANAVVARLMASAPPNVIAAIRHLLILVRDLSDVCIFLPQFSGIDWIDCLSSRDCDCQWSANREHLGVGDFFFHPSAPILPRPKNELGGILPGRGYLTIGKPP